MTEERGEPVIRQGTLPSPSDPDPSNQIIKEYPDGTCDILTPQPTAKVLEEYKQAIADAPADAGLHLYYGFALWRVEDREAAFEQVREAVRLKPEWDFAHSQLASFLQEAGDAQAAVAEYREALRLRLAEQEYKPRQGEATLRCGLAQALRQKGDLEEARTEIERALALQQEMVRNQRGSQRLLERMEAELANYA